MAYEASIIRITDSDLNRVMRDIVSGVSPHPPGFEVDSMEDEGINQRHAEYPHRVNRWEVLFAPDRWDWPCDVYEVHAPHAWHDDSHRVWICYGVQQLVPGED